MSRVPITSNQIKYDADHDILHVFFSPMVLSEDDEEFPGIVIRRSVSDDRITGLVIMDFTRRRKDFLESVLPRYDFSQIPFH